MMIRQSIDLFDRNLHLEIGKLFGQPLIQRTNLIGFHGSQSFGEPESLKRDVPENQLIWRNVARLTAEQPIVEDRSPYVETSG